MLFFGALLGNVYECNFRAFCPEVQIKEIKEEHEMCDRKSTLWTRAPTGDVKPVTVEDYESRRIVYEDIEEGFSGFYDCCDGSYIISK